MMQLTDKLGEEDHKEGRDQVVDPLDVTAGRVSDGPDEQDSLEHLKREHGGRMFAQRKRAGWECCGLGFG